MWLPIRCLLVLTGLILGGIASASAVSAAEIHGRSSTQYLWFNDIFTEKRQAEFGEYLNVSATQLDKDNKLSIQGYGRATYDLHDVGDGSNFLEGRLYYLYLDYRELYDKVDLRFGRTFVNYAAGSALIDGAQIELKNIGPVAFSVMGGRNVFFDLTGEGTRSKDRVYGAAAYLQGFKKTDAELSYFRKEDEDGVARDQFGMSFKHYMLNSVKVYANARYDLASEVFNELLAGAKYYPTSDLIFTVERYESYPTFDNTSIYAVFAVDRYKENVFRADYTINEKIAVNAGYTYEDFEGDDANVFDAGIRTHPTEKLQLVLDYERRSGYGGDLNGGMVEISYEGTEQLELAAGIHYDVYERDRTTGRETARKYWAGGKYKLAKNMSTSVRIEDDVNASFNSDWSGRVVFNYDF
jgi:hypothetical protein